jgi:hypothetical protein
VSRNLRIGETRGIKSTRSISGDGNEHLVCDLPERRGNRVRAWPGRLRQFNGEAVNPEFDGQPIVIRSMAQADSSG